MDEELDRLHALWERLKAEGGRDGVSPELIERLEIHRGQQGIYRDLERTRALTKDGSGVAVGVLHTGSHYADDLSESGVIYHYPQTSRGGRGQGEIRSLAACRELQLPLFVVITPLPHTRTRDVRLGWVADLDDFSGQALIVFSESPPAEAVGQAAAEEPFLLQENRPAKAAVAKARPNQWRFRYDVLKRYGPSCAFCGLQVVELLQAAHICPVEEGVGATMPATGWSYA
jgi:putative restriction endonuclease